MLCISRYLGYKHVTLNGLKQGISNWSPKTEIRQSVTLDSFYSLLT